MKVFKLNKSGTLGVTLSKEVKADYPVGTEIDWIKVTGGWLLKKGEAKPEKIISKPIEPSKAEAIETPAQTEIVAEKPI